MYLAIDLGTTGCRSMLFDSGFQVVAASYEEYPLITPREGWVEQDATLWWQLTLRTARQAIEMAGIDPGAIRGISVSSQGILLEAMEAYGTVDSLVLFGGGAKSPLWCQIMADITGMQICVPVTEEAAGAGAAMLAAQALGQRIEPLPWARRYSPGEDCRDYGEKYARYRAVEKKLWGRDGA